VDADIAEARRRSSAVAQWRSRRRRRGAVVRNEAEARKRGAAQRLGGTEAGRIESTHKLALIPCGIRAGILRRG
jgi:hypothetical protein